MRTATLSKPKGKTLPDLKAPPAPLPAGNGPDNDEILFSIGQIETKLDIIEKAKSELKKFRQHLKLRGFNLAMLDMAIAEKDKEDGTTTSNLVDFQRYCQALNLPVGFQFSLFDRPQTSQSVADLMTRAFGEGRERGIRGQQPDDQKWLPMSDEGREHQRGWAEGQKVLTDKFEALNVSYQEAEKEREAKAAKAARKAAKAAEADKPDVTETDIGPADGQ